MIQVHEEARTTPEPHFETISKLDAARRQLRTSIRLFFADEEAISVHTLVAAAHGILRDLSGEFAIQIAEGVELQGKGSFLKDNPLVRPEKKKMLVAALNRAQNFFKHADNDPSGELHFHAGQTEFLLFDACLMYQSIAGRHLREGYLFMVWHMVKYPEIYLDDASKQFIAHLQAFDFTSKPEMYELIKLGTPIPGTD
ncbi:MAG: hypothetical protein V3T53_14205 [Phycisphaerales bacterium]